MVGSILSRNIIAEVLACKAANFGPLRSGSHSVISLEGAARQPAWPHLFFKSFSEFLKSMNMIVQMLYCILVIVLSCAFYLTSYNVSKCHAVNKNG
jgi:hypothetical protein